MRLVILLGAAVVGLVVLTLVAWGLSELTKDR